MKLQKYNQMFEADIKKNKGVPQDYIEDVERKGREMYGYTGPNRAEFMEMMESLNDVFKIQEGHHDELTEIGKEIIMNHYGGLLEDVKLDIKIVRPDDEEKAEMAAKTQDDDDDGDDEEQEPEIPSDDIELPEEPVDQDEVDKRKILNNLMQGEAQNIHSMMHEVKDKIDGIDEFLLDLYSRVLEINKKFDWFDQAQMMENPEMGNFEEVDWEEDEESGEITPVIKVRALDLPMLIHETVKGIYELIMSNAIPDNEYLAKRIMAETDNLENEKEDIKFGPFIAADIRDFINEHLERKHSGSIGITNLREFIYSKMVELDANAFISLIYAMLSDDIDTADKLIEEFTIVERAIEDATYDPDDAMEYDGDDGDDHDEIVNMMKDKYADSDPEEPKEKEYADMSKAEKDKILNQALDDSDFETIKKLQPYL